MKSLVMIFLLTASASLTAAPNFKKLDYQELRAFDTSTLSEKDLKKYNKAWKKAVKKREKIIDRARKKHDKAEKKRIKALSKTPENSIYRRTTVSQSEFDPAPVAMGTEFILEGTFFLASMGHPGIKFFMQSAGDDQFELYVIDAYDSEWRNWSSARLSGGKDANLNSVSKETFKCEEPFDCTYKEEHFTLTLPANFWNDWYKAGGGNLRVEIRGTGKKKSDVLEFPEAYFYGYLDKINDQFNVIEPDLVRMRRASIDEALQPKPFVLTEAIFE